jgi:hypothetical protein
MMGRIQLRCTCGWTFFIAESSSARDVPCASCGAPVDVSTGSLVTAQAEAAEQVSHDNLRWVYRLLAAVLVVGVIAAILISARPVPLGAPRPVREIPPEVEDGKLVRRAAAPAPQPAAPVPVPVEPRPQPPPPPPVPAPAVVRLPAVEIAQLRRAVPETVALLNLGGIVAEILKLRGLDEEHAKLSAQIADWKASLNASIARLAHHGERCVADAHFQPGDRIVGFARKDLQKMHPADAANVLASWLAGFRAPTPSEHVGFLREGRKFDDYVSFAEETEGMRRLLRTSGIAPNAAPVSSLVQAIPESLLLRLHARLKELPEGYRRILPETERRRLELLLAARVGSQDDLLFLESRILGEAVPAFEKDAAAVRLKAADLEKKVEESTAVDVLHFKDGRRISGQFLEENEKGVKFRGRFGAVQFPKEEVLRVERGRGAGVEFPERLKAAGRAPEKLAPLLAWCRERKLGAEAEYVACLILAQDPLHEEARTASGIRRPAAR